MSKISVLIPAYNVARYLPKCLDSVLSQTFKDFEVVLVDDGSTDETVNICDAYANKDSRIRVFHQENKGISATRELCLLYAKGDYVQFVDGDDWIEKDMLKSMYEKALVENAEIVGCNFIIEKNEKSVQVETCYDCKETFLQDVLRNRWGVLWKLLIKRSLYEENNICFPQGINGGEDFVFVVKCLTFAKYVVCVSEFLYHYNQMNETSFISQSSFDRLMEQYRATELVAIFLKKEGVFDNSVLNYRKVCVKSKLLKFAFLKSYGLYPEIDLYACCQRMSIKRKLLFFLSFLLNKIKTPRAI